MQFTDIPIAQLSLGDGLGLVLLWCRVFIYFLCCCCFCATKSCWWIKIFKPHVMSYCN